MFGHLRQWVRLIFDTSGSGPADPTYVIDAASNAVSGHAPMATRSTDELSPAACLSPADLRWLSRFHTLLGMDAKAVTRVLSPSILRLALIALKEFHRMAQQPGSDLAARALKLGAVHNAAIVTLHKTNVDLEHRVRTLAWALDAPVPYARRVRVVFAPTPNNTLNEPMIELKCMTPPSTFYWWMCADPIPSWLTRRVRESASTLLLDAGVPVRGCRLPCLVDINPAVVEMPRHDGETAEIVVGGAAGYIQSLLRTSNNRSWVAVHPPLGFHRLRHDVMRHEERSLAARGEIATVYSDGNQEILVRSIASILNPPAQIR